MDSNQVCLDRGDGTSCQIHLFGATITSWKVFGSEQLFMDKDEVFDGKTPIGGGIPIVFPKFSHWEGKPFHGFARESMWSVESSPTTDEAGDVKAVLKLMDTPKSRSYWNYAFSMNLEVVLRQTQLTTNLSVHNPSSKQSFAFELLLHTYFRLPDVSKCSVTGFQGCSYLDNTQGLQEFVQDTDTIAISKHTDNIFRETSDIHVISNVNDGRSVKITKYNLPDTVVWNPWDSEESSTFLCVESGHVANPVLLAPAQTFTASQVLQIE